MISKDVVLFRLIHTYQAHRKGLDLSKSFFLFPCLDFVSNSPTTHLFFLVTYGF